jgi:hypothetical protein
MWIANKIYLKTYWPEDYSYNRNLLLIYDVKKYILVMNGPEYEGSMIMWKSQTSTHLRISDNLSFKEEILENLKTSKVKTIY